MTRAELVATARDSIARGSKSFAMASRLFDPVTRERAWLLYAWCRACDDLADGQVMGHGVRRVDDPAERLATIRTLTGRALAGEATGDPAFDALGAVAAETGLPHRFAHDLVEGFALDAAGFRPADEDDLLRYCYHVAGVVGVMMAIIMGVRPDQEAVLDRACDLGLAFQLSNIARDIVEDAAAGRCYLPLDWLDQAGIPADRLGDPEHRAGLAAIAARLADTAGRFEASARYGTPALPYRSAWAVLAAAGIYGGIGRAVAARGAHAWDERVTTGKSAKIRCIVRAAAQARRRNSLWRASPPREGLWTRPSAQTPPAAPIL